MPAAEKNRDVLFRKLKESYTERNLHKIAHNLIRLYREKQFEKLQIIAEMVPDLQIGTVCDKQGFSRLISLYHPDRIQFYNNELEKYNISKDVHILQKLEHILFIQDIEEIVSNIESFQDIDYTPEFMWDIDSEGFTFFNINEKPNQRKKHKNTAHGRSFYDAVITRMNGNIDINFPFCYLENMDEVEMAESGINNLDGIEYCIHVTNIDLSGNMITDLTPLLDLKKLKELNLSDNKIWDIDVLGNLQQLRIIDLSNNPIDDLSPLFELELLEYLNITLNHILPKQIKQLENRGVVINISEI